MLFPRFEAFIRERQYLHNVTPATIAWYKQSLRWLPAETPTQDELNDAVIRMRAQGKKASGVNCALRCINAYLKWSGSSLKVAPLKEPREVMSTFSAVQVQKLVAWKPKTLAERRLGLLVLFLLDTGCRISEALSVRVRDIDLDNLLVTLDGKGRKQRVVPFSFALRKALFRFLSAGHLKRQPDDLVFAGRTGTALSRNNALRDVKLLCKELRFAPPARTLHAFRHTFAVNYLRCGGSVFHLQKVLGHSSLEMTRRYANLVTSDLQAVHEKVSLLSKTA